MIEVQACWILGRFARPSLPANTNGAGKPVTLRFPRIDQRRPGVREVCDIARGYQSRVPGVGCRRDLKVGLADWASLTTTGGRERCERLGRRAIEGQDPPPEHDVEHSPRGALQFLAATTIRQEIYAIEHFSLAYGRRVHFVAALRIRPSHDRWVGNRLGEFGDHVRVENDHRSRSHSGPEKSGGSRSMNSPRSGSSNSTPPSGPKTARTASPSVCLGAGFPPLDSRAGGREPRPPWTGHGRSHWLSGGRAARRRHSG